MATTKHSPSSLTTLRRTRSLGHKRSRLHRLSQLIKGVIDRRAWGQLLKPRVIIGDDTIIGSHVLITETNYWFDDGRSIHDQSMDTADIVLEAGP